MNEIENAYKAKLQVAYTWIIAQDKCPECFGDLKPRETIIGNVHRIDQECCECGRMWKHFGEELTWEEWNLWKTEAKALTAGEKR